MCRAPFTRYRKEQTVRCWMGRPQVRGQGWGETGTRPTAPPRDLEQVSCCVAVGWQICVWTRAALRGCMLPCSAWDVHVQPSHLAQSTVINPPVRNVSVFLASAWHLSVWHLSLHLFLHGYYCRVLSPSRPGSHVSFLWNVNCSGQVFHGEREGRVGGLAVFEYVIKKLKEKERVQVLSSPTGKRILESLLPLYESN